MIRTRNDNKSRQAGPRRHGLDVLRAFAIIWVLLFHALVYGWGSPCPSFARWGWMGVDLFFVLSGYLIGGQLLRASDGGRHVSFWEFYCPITSSPFTGP